MENCILYDWVSITSKIHSPENFIELLGLNQPGISWEQIKGAHGYRDRLYWEKISIHYNGREDMGVWLEMSGQGCRAFETFGSGDYAALFDEVLQEPEQMNLTRLDVAFDDHTGILPLKLIAADTQELEEATPVHFVSRFSKRSVEWAHTDGFPRPALTVYHGSKSSACMIRIYDKAAERGFFDQHWVRCELQMRDARALAFVQNSGNPGETFRGVLHNYLRYVDKDPHDSNRWRWPVKQYWADLLDGVAPIRLYSKPGADYNMVNLENYIFTQAAGAIYTYLECFGVEMFLRRLKEDRGELNPKYKQLLAQYGRR